MGEWGLNLVENLVNDPKCLMLTHRGLEHFFKENGHDVVNISKGGGSNYLNTKKFENVLKENYDYIFWFQTDFLRDDRIFITRPSKKVSWEDAKNAKKEYYTKWYSKLNSYNKKIYLLGGANRIDINLVLEFKNIIPIIPCIFDFLIPQTNIENDILFGGWVVQKEFSRSGKPEFVSNELDTALLEKIVKVNEINLKDKNINFARLFWPDGKHPNRLGHKIIFDYLCEQLKI